jgi:pimeloyl-ACP methyl ester carboxylesterase
VDLRPSSRRPAGLPPGRVATLLTDDGVRISAAHDPAPSRSTLAFVVAHGFTGSWRRPDNRRIAATLREFGDVVSYDSRGHGSSSGVTTLGDDEVLDLDAAIGWARWLGARTIVSVGFSMGGTVVLRQAALARREARETPQAVVSVSSAGFWFYRGTAPMRLLHRAVAGRTGRGVLRVGYGTRVTSRMWEEPYPLSPSEAASLLPPMPLLVVHGDRDHYFPVEHARSLVDAAADGARRRGVQDRTTEWIEAGFAHAESASTVELVRRIGLWAHDAVSVPGLPGAEP